jgi:hypothetical protein
VDQLANAAFVAAVRRSSFKRRALPQTLSTKRRRESAGNEFAAQQATLTNDWFQGFETFRTERQEGADSERKSAKTAIRGGEHGHNAVEAGARDGTYQRVSSSSEESFSDPSSISRTAEDDPPENTVSIALPEGRKQRM